MICEMFKKNKSYHECMICYETLESDRFVNDDEEEFKLVCEHT